MCVFNTALALAIGLLSIYIIVRNWRARKQETITLRTRGTSTSATCSVLPAPNNANIRTAANTRNDDDGAPCRTVMMTTVALEYPQSHQYLWLTAPEMNTGTEAMVFLPRIVSSDAFQMNRQQWKIQPTSLGSTAYRVYSMAYPNQVLAQIGLMEVRLIREGTGGIREVFHTNAHDRFTLMNDAGKSIGYYALPLVKVADAAFNFLPSNTSYSQLRSNGVVLDAIPVSSEGGSRGDTNHMWRLEY
jgi:hypothetical protein